jgi:hypothetical protein
MLCSTVNQSAAIDVQTAPALFDPEGLQPADLGLPDNGPWCELAPVDRGRPGPSPIAAILSHVVLGADERFLLGRRQAEFTGRHDDLKTSVLVEQMHRPQSVGAQLDLNGKRLYFRQTRVPWGLHGRSVAIPPRAGGRAAQSASGSFGEPKHTFGSIFMTPVPGVAHPIASGRWRLRRPGQPSSG